MNEFKIEDFTDLELDRIRGAAIGDYVRFGSVEISRIWVECVMNALRQKGFTITRRIKPTSTPEDQQDAKMMLFRGVATLVQAFPRPRKDESFEGYKDRVMGYLELEDK